MVLIAFAAWIFLTKVFVITQAQGQNMFPSVKDGDLIIAFRLERNYVKGDIVLDKPLEKIAGLLTKNPADLLGLSGQGSLAPGSFADITAVNLEGDILATSGRGEKKKKKKS